ncbi:protein of unknown function [Ectopseudomonas oleovorans]|nr:protein of unknown function [Pseudomonas oleovorans]
MHRPGALCVLFVYTIETNRIDVKPATHAKIIRLSLERCSDTL